MTCDICAGGDVETTTIVCDECLDHQHWLRFCESWVAIGYIAYICDLEDRGDGARWYWGWLLGFDTDQQAAIGATLPVEPYKPSPKQCARCELWFADWIAERDHKCRRAGIAIPPEGTP